MKQYSVRRSQGNARPPYAFPPPYAARFSGEGGEGQYRGALRATFGAAVYRADANDLNETPPFEGPAVVAGEPTPTHEGPRTTPRSRRRVITLDEAAENEELRRRRERARRRSAALVVTQSLNFIPESFPQQLVQRALTPIHYLTPSSYALQNALPLPTPPESPVDRVDSPQLAPNASRRVGGASFTINVPVDATEPFTYKDCNDEFPNLSDLLHSSRAHDSGVPSYHEPMGQTQELQHNIAQAYFLEPVAQDAQWGSLNFPMYNQCHADSALSAAIPGLFNARPPPAPYFDFVRSSAPSPSPHPAYVSQHPFFISADPVSQITQEELHRSPDLITRVVDWLNDHPPTHGEYDPSTLAERDANEDLDSSHL